MVKPQRTTPLMALWSASVAVRRTGPPGAHGYLPAVYGSGAAVLEVHPRGRCCRMRPFSSHSRSHRPWSDFLRSSLTFRLGLLLLALGWKAVRRGSLSRGVKIQTARRGLASLRGVTGSLNTNVTNNQCGCSSLNREGRCRDALVSVCASEWRRERAFDAFPWNSAGSMTPSLTVGNFAITG